VLGIVVAAVIAITFAVWAFWAGPGDLGTGSLQTNDIGYKVHSNQLTTVRSQVQVAPGTAVKCAIEVEDKSFSIVGWKIVSVPATTAQSSEFMTTVKTSSRGVTGLINACWVP
jgi:hypothetical protein